VMAPQRSLRDTRRACARCATTIGS
jgi:hypothetical protein